MAERTIETRAVISAEDRTGPAFAAVVQHMARMEEAARHASARVKVAAAAEGQSGEARRQIIAQHRAAAAEERRALVEQRAARREEMAHLHGVQQMHQDISGRQMALGIAGAYAAEKTAHFAHVSLETYREFDKERRFGKAVMGISDDDQADLVKQAIHLGATTKYNDIQVLESQRELAARGLKKEQIIGMMGAAADLGQSLDLSLPDAVKQMEGAIFGFKKSIATTAEAMGSARQTADVQVRAAKISGMTPEDIKDTYKYGATPARLSGVSEQTLLAFGGISKKANMAGNEAGTAFRALMSAANAPTRGAKEAMLANGLDYAKYQKKIDHIDVDPFVRNVAAQYGVKLNKSAVHGLTKAFGDPRILNDPALFTPAVTHLLGRALSGKDAKSLKSIAGMANRFRTATGGGADVNALLSDLMTKMGGGKGGIALANAIFGAKQGGRIANALGDPDTLKRMVETLTGHSEGYAKKIADERMSGFDGAVSRFEGATKNLETALGRAFDANGKGGFLTGAADTAGRFVQALAEAPPQLQRLGAEAGAAAAIFAGFKGAEALLGGFGLKGSAVALTEAAHALMGAAGARSVAGLRPGEVAADKYLAGGEPGTTPAKGGKPSVMMPIGQVMAYQSGRELIDGALSLLPHPAYPRGYDPDAKLNEGPIDRLGDIWKETRGARTWLKNAILPAAHAEPAPHVRAASPYGALVPLKPAGTAGTLDPKAPAAKDTKVETKVDVAFQQPPPLKVDVAVNASSQLLQIVDGLKTLAVQLKAQVRADTGPGGLGETHTGQ